MRRTKVPGVLNITRLAKLARVGRSHLNQVLAGQRDGKRTWPLLFPFLTEWEIRGLGKLESFRAWKSFHVEQSEAFKRLHGEPTP